MSEDVNPEGEETEELVAVARIAKTRGIRGEVAADLLTDFPERFDGLEELISVNASGERTTLSIENCWLHGGRVILKFAGYDSPEAAKALVGRELAVPEADAVELEEDEFYDWELIDCRVETIDNRDVGRVREVLHTGAAPVLVVRDDGGAREHLIPLAESICVEIDTEEKLIRVDPPEGLLEF
ncbi:MAG TPA: ribosome maturation factor RimM [Pyrinomonadaceae bacterium]|nr:ribosome maturation factor RimM [Pyrinomonadaceae bacterium]